MNDDQRLAKEREVCNLYANVFGGPDGQTVMRDLMAYCGKDALCFDSDNPHRTAFMLGARSVALYILERVNGDTLRRMEKLLRES